eukprot:CAMPEP_0172617360 /NCGR_PEP_ID=MMETSP1068-20121228/70204_1 /TAXON_ID=35684 /ORGANISM="Pseudopedinella elastica, Strain CCMP716" /LENGTH=40 /DNA_ID= /DNA_START= /DNA_END= /DNA_ORIENTATION=
MKVAPFKLLDALMKDSDWVARAAKTEIARRAPKFPRDILI